MPAISAVHHLSLTVTDLAKSVAWYRDVLGFTIDAEIERETFRRTRLRHPDCELILTLTRHLASASERFDERHPGLDHVAFLVPGVAHLEAWKQRLEAHGVDHSEIKPLGKDRSAGAMITLRDPDHIQLEVVATAMQPRQSSA